MHLYTSNKGLHIDSYSTRFDYTYVIEWKVDKNIFILKTFKVICQESDGIRNKMKIKFF